MVRNLTKDGMVIRDSELILRCYLFVVRKLAGTIDKEIKDVDQVENDWYEFVEYGSTNKQVISIQRHGFTRESAIYILKHPEYVANPEPELKLKRNIETCGNRGVCDDMDLVKYNLPDLFVD